MQPQPSVLDVEPELPTNDRQVEVQSDTILKVSGSACDLELGNERNLAINGDGEGPCREVDVDDNLPKLSVSSPVQKAIKNYPDSDGTKTETDFVGFGGVLLWAVHITNLHRKDVDFSAIGTFLYAMMLVEPLVNWKNPSYRGEQDSLLTARDIYRQEPLSQRVSGHIKTQDNQEKMTHGKWT